MSTLRVMVDFVGCQKKGPLFSEPFFISYPCSVNLIGILN